MYQVFHQLQTIQLKDVVPAELAEYVPEMPDTGVAAGVSEVCQSVSREVMWGYYNSPVLATMDTVSNLPQTVQSSAGQAVEWVQEQAK